MHTITYYDFSQDRFRVEKIDDGATATTRFRVLRDRQYCGCIKHLAIAYPVDMCGPANESANDAKYADVSLADVADTYGVQARIDAMMENEFILADARYNDNGLPKPYDPATATVRSKPVEKLAGDKGGGDKGGLPQATSAMVNRMVARYESIRNFHEDDKPSLFDDSQFHPDL